ncbi:sensor histidine kinase [Variovorax boronicumulans]|uniref:sensor histidine kinase n=1 Tax=Variovorax boronicumulans TaxID=436515 RepID=UPI001C563F75
MTSPATEPRSRFGIRARLLALLLPCILGLLALDSWNDYRALRSLVQDAYDSVMLEAADALRRSVVPAADGALQLDASAAQVQRMFEAASRKTGHLRVELRPQGAAPAAGRLLLGDADLPPPPAGSDGASPVWFDGSYRGQPVRMVALRSTVVDGHGQSFELRVQTAEGTEPRQHAEAASLRQQFFRDARMVVLVILLVWLGVTWSLRPLERLRRSVVQRRGQLPEPLDAGGVPHEVAPLVEAVNQNVASYRGLLDQQSQFLADASHQLRTPLAIMLTQAGVALREKDSTQLHATLRAMVTQIARSRRLCEQLLSLAHANDGTQPPQTSQRADLNAISKDVVLQYLTLAHEKEQDLGWVDAREDAATGDATRPAVPVQADAAELHEALANLVHNAIAYTPVGGRITVTAGVVDGVACAEVSDDGPGIAPARRAAVFERFRQAGDRAGKPTGGAGLGLAIARAYAQRNGGDIVLADAEVGTGLRAILQLPPAPPQAD